MIWLVACTPDYGVRTDEVVVEEVVWETTDGHLDVIEGEVVGNELDILWVMDVSCSMSEELKTVGDAAADIAEQLEELPFRDLQWRMGAIMATTADAGAARWTTDAGDAANLFDDLTLAASSTNDAGEQGLDAALWSMAWDRDFHRDTANLLTIFVADEDDHSNTDPATYRSQAQGVKAAPLTINHSAVVHLDGSCMTGTGEQVGDAYVAVSDYTVSICNPSDWVDAMEPARWLAGTMGRVWSLNYAPLKPAESNVLVMVDGALTVEWEYDQDANAVELWSTPEVGATVVIAYIW